MCRIPVARTTLLTETFCSGTRSSDVGIGSAQVCCFCQRQTVTLEQVNSRTGEGDHICTGLESLSEKDAPWLQSVYGCGLPQIGEWLSLLPRHPGHSLLLLCSKPSFLLWSLVSPKPEEDSHCLPQQNPLKSFFEFVLLFSHPVAREDVLHAYYFVPDTVVGDAEDG